MGHYDSDPFHTVKRCYILSWVSAHIIWWGDYVRVYRQDTLVKNKYTTMYLKCIYFMLSILQIHLRSYVLNKNTLQLYF